MCDSHEYIVSTVLYGVNYYCRSSGGSSSDHLSPSLRESPYDASIQRSAVVPSDPSAGLEPIPEDREELEM